MGSSTGGKQTFSKESEVLTEALGGAELSQNPRDSQDSQTSQQSRDSNNSDDRTRRIEAAAYCRAERRGFEPGADLDDWLAAEREIDGEAGQASRE